MFNGRNRLINYYFICLNFFHNEIISFCLENGTILKASGAPEKTVRDAGIEPGTATLQPRGNSENFTYCSPSI
jgi:hypothetical protein